MTMTECKYCDEPITFDDDYVSESGKKIPLDEDTHEPHQCPEREQEYRQRQEPVECYKCGGMITFDNKHRSKSGKMIPLNWSGRQPHQCPDDKDEDEDE